MMLLDARSLTTADGPLQVQSGEGHLAKQGVDNPQPIPNSGKPASGGETPGTEEETKDTVVVQFSVIFDGGQEKFDYLWSMRNTMHRVLNAAMSEWHRADKIASRTNPEKETLDRGAITAAVKGVLQREREYWAKQADAALSQVERIRVDLGRARAKSRAEDEERLSAQLAEAQRRYAREIVKATSQMPSSVYDSAVRFTASRYALYKKDAFRGDRTLDTYRAGQPIRWRDGSWKLSEGEKRGRYQLKLQLSSDGKKVEHGTFEVIPDGPGMYFFAKRMADEEAVARGEVKLCDARLVYAEKKKQWFAKLTIQIARRTSAPAGSRCAALRRGVSSAFVLVFEDDDGFVKTIEGQDVLAFKRRIKARKESLSAHTSKLELGGGARGRGKARRFRGLRKIDDSEDRFIDTRCKTWAAALAAECVDRKVGRLLVSKMGAKEMADGEEVVQALLYQWPFARMLDKIRQACAKVPVDDRGRAIRSKFDAAGERLVPADKGRAVAGYAEVRVEEFEAHYDARRCPKCGHVHEKRPVGTFVCEVCELSRPADQIVAWNGLLRALGGKEVLEKSEKKVRERGKRIAEALKKETSDGDR